MRTVHFIVPLSLYMFVIAMFGFAHAETASTPYICVGPTNISQSISNDSTTVNLAWAPSQYATSYNIRLDDGVNGPVYDDPRFPGRCGPHYYCENGIDAATHCSGNTCTVTNIPVVPGRTYAYWIDPIYPSPGASSYCNSSTSFSVAIPTPTQKCVATTFNPATSGFSTSPTGPAQPTLSVVPGQTFYAFADFGLIADSIWINKLPIGPCKWAGSINQPPLRSPGWNNTAAVFICTAPSATGLYTLTAGTHTETASNTCNNLNVIGSLNVVAKPACIQDSDCDDHKAYTIDKCINQDSFYTDGSSAASCFHTPQLTGTRAINLLVVEFAPQGVNYGKLYYCHNNIQGYYFQTMKEYCDNEIEEHNFLEITNNPREQFSFTNLREVDKLNNPHSLFYLNHYLKKEASKYSVKEIPHFNIDIKGPFSLSEYPPKTTGVVEMMQVDNFFDNKIKELNIDTSKYDFIVVVYFNDYDVLSNVDRHAFVNHAGATGKVYISLSTYRIFQDLSAHVLIHELLHKFGASDTYVFGEGEGAPPWCSMFSCCTDPDGIPEPNKVPKYPQTKGCIMCAEGEIVLQYGKEQQTPSSLDQTVICDKTAEEIGWKSRSISVQTSVSAKSRTANILEPFQFQNVLLNIKNRVNQVLSTLKFTN